MQMICDHNSLLQDKKTMRHSNADLTELHKEKSKFIQNIDKNSLLKCVNIKENVENSSHKLTRHYNQRKTMHNKWKVIC